MAYNPHVDFLTPAADDPTLVDLLDRLLDKGVVVSGDIRVSVAGVDLLFLGLKVLLCSVGTAERYQLAATGQREAA